MEEGLHRQQQVVLNLSELNIDLSAADVANKNSKTIPGDHLSVMGIYRKSAEQLTKRNYNYHKHQFNLYQRDEHTQCSVFDWTDGSQIKIFSEAISDASVLISVFNFCSAVQQQT